MRIAVIGVGVVGQIHINVLLEQRFNIVAICDIDTDKTKEYPTIPAYTDYQEMIEKEKPDAVHICTPHYLHKEMVVYALKRDIHVLCEKPLCIKREDIDEILAVEKDSKAQLGVCFQNRYLPCNQYLKGYLKDKQVQCAFASLAWTRDKEYYDSAPWRGSKAFEGGGLLINQAIHTLDLLIWLLDEPQYVTASVTNLTLKEVIDVEDTATLICSGKANFVFSATNGSKAFFSAEVRFQTDTDRIRLFDNKLEINDKIMTFENDKKFFGKECYGWGHAVIIEDFYDCLQTGRKFPIDGIEGTKALKLVLSAYKSQGEKIPVR